MASRKGTQPEARRRAREAKAKLDQARAEYDRKVEDATTGFYEAQANYEHYLAEAQTAKHERNTHIVELLAIEKSAPRVAALTGLSVHAVRTAKRTQPQSGVQASAPAHLTHDSHTEATA